MATSNGNIGLNITGAASYVTNKTLLPSGDNREFGYWRGSYNKTSTNRFNKLYMALEGTGLYSGAPRVVAVKATEEAAGIDCTEGVTDAGLGSTGCVWVWYDDDPEEDPGWSLYDDSECISGCGCTGQEPTYEGSSMDVDSTACVNIGSVAADTPDQAGDGFAVWQRAGTLKGQIGKEAIQERSLFLAERSNVNLGSGVTLSATKGFTIYSKILPSGDISDTVILAQHRENPAQFVLGCDFDGKYYIRSDGSVSGKNAAYYAKSERSYQEYRYPAHVVGVYASGDKTLKIYVNGKEEGRSGAFSRDITGGDNSNIVLGKRGFAISERGFTGWVDEAGISSESFSPEDVKKFYDHTFNITSILETTSPPTGAALDARYFSSAFDAKDKDYIQFIVESGNSESVLGGAFDRNLWGQAGYAVSSVLDVRLQETPPRFHQLKGVSVDVWVENSTNHPSGAKLSAAIKHKSRGLPAADNKDLNWSASGIMIPSGSKRLITFTSPLEKSDSFFPGGQGSAKSAFQDHELKFTVYYPSYDHPYDAEFKVYSTKVRFDSFEQVGKINTYDGELLDGQRVNPSYKDRSPALFTKGGFFTRASGTANLFVNAATAAQSLDLFLDAHIPLLRVSGSMMNSPGAIGTVVRNSSMNLNLLGALERSDMNLYTAGLVYNATNEMKLETKGGIGSYPFSSKTMPLFLKPEAASGIYTASMNLAFPNVSPAKFNISFPQFIEGKKPFATMPLSVKVTETGVNTTPLYALGPTAYKSSGTMNLIMKPLDPQFIVRGSTFKGLPNVLTNNSMDFVTKGYHNPSGSLPLIMAGAKVVTSGETTMFVRGYSTD
tara:strand:- start:1792 stop:4290 length:2499 start_codon:yes stop_codon:yes gene_type:complete